jgi:hypothetical protein
MAADAIEQRGLSGPVGAYQAEDRTGLDVEAHVLQNLDPAEMQVHVLEAQARGHRSTFLSHHC